MRKLLSLLLCLMLLCACAPTAPRVTPDPTAVLAPEVTPAPSPKTTPIAVAKGETADVFLAYNGEHYGIVDSAGACLSDFLYSDIRLLSGERLILTIENEKGLPLCALALLSGERLSEHIYSEITELGNGMGKAVCRETGETHLIGLDTGLVLAVLPAHMDLIGVSATAATMLVIDTDSAHALCYSLADALRGEFTELARYDEEEVDHCCYYWPETGLAALHTDDETVLFGAGSEPVCVDEIHPPFDGEYIRFTERHKNGYCDWNGNVVIQRKFRESGNFCNGLAWAKDVKKYGYVNTAGEFVIEAEYTACSDFFHGYAFVTLTDGTGALIDATGATVVHPISQMLTYTADNGDWLVMTVSPSGSTLIRRDSMLRYEGILSCKDILFTSGSLCALMLADPNSDMGYPLLFHMDTGAILQSGSSYTDFTPVPSAINAVYSGCFTGTRADGKLDLFTADGALVLSGADLVLGAGKQTFSVVYDGSCGIVDATGAWVRRLAVVSTPPM